MPRQFAKAGVGQAWTLSCPLGVRLRWRNLRNFNRDASSKPLIVMPMRKIDPAPSVPRRRRLFREKVTEVSIAKPRFRLCVLRLAQPTPLE
jgi:hypothetical protein